MCTDDKRAEFLGWVETQLRMENPDLTRLRLTALSHYASGGFAFIDVHGVDEDTPRRRAIRATACDLLHQLGSPVVLDPGRDVYSFGPLRPQSGHEALMMLSELHRRIAATTL